MVENACHSQSETNFLGENVQKMLTFKVFFKNFVLKGDLTTISHVFVLKIKSITLISAYLDLGLEVLGVMTGLEDGLPLDVVVGHVNAILHLLAGEDQRLLVLRQYYKLKHN